MPRNQFDININLKGFPEAQANFNKTKQGMDRMRLSTSGLKRQIGALRNNMLLYAFTIGAIQRVTNNLISTYRKQIQAERLLENNLKNISGVSKDASSNLKQLASSLQQVTTFGDEDIIMAQSLLATFQLTESTIAQLTPRILDMASAMGTDLRQAAILLGKAFVGETSRLKQIGLVIDEFAMASAKAKGPIAEAAFLLKTFDNNFKGAARALRDTPLGELDGLVLKLGDLEEQLGKTAIPLEVFLTSTKLFVVESLTAWAFFFDEFASLAGENSLRWTKSWQVANERVKAISGETTSEILENGVAQTNSYDKARLSLEELNKEIAKNLKALDTEIASTRSKIFALYGATDATIAQVAAQRTLTKKELERVDALEKLNKQLNSMKEIEDVFSKTLEGTTEAQRDKIRLVMAEIYRNAELLGSQDEVKLVLAELKKAYEELDPTIQDKIDKDSEYRESIKSNEQALRDELRSLQAQTDALSGADLATIRSMELGRALTDTERELISTIESYNKIIEDKIGKTDEETALLGTFNNVLRSTTEGEIAHLKTLITKIEASTVLLGTEKERTIVLEDLKNKIKELEEEGSTSNLAKDANEMANGFLAASRAMTTLRDSTEITHGQLLQVIGSLMMLAPGGQVPGAVVQSLGMFVGHTGGLIKNSGIQRFAQGGMVQGQDNVPILAQAGEFIMKREAVQNIGVENLAEMNRGQANASVTVNIQGNMIGNDEFVRDNLIPQIQKVSRQGLA
tara:strand:- start:10816 stop:13047 length:2232 start_codon:yes stop_codon:yes gene_type:complete